MQVRNILKGVKRVPAAPMDPRLAADLRKSLVATLFASPISIAVGSAVGSAVAFTAAFRTQDSWFYALAWVMSGVAALRVAHVAGVKSPLTSASMNWQEAIYEGGAWVYSALLGALTFLVLTGTDDPPLRLLAACTTVGYAAGLAFRNAGRPTIAIGQLALTLTPFIIALFIISEPLSWVLGAGTILFGVALGDIILKTYRSVAGALAAARAREDQWQETLDSLPQMVWATDAEGTPRYHNKQWVSFAGSDLAVSARAELVHPDDLPWVMEQWRLCVSSGDPYEAEYRLLHKSGEYRWVVSRGLPRRDTTGAITGWYGTCTDVHERITANRALRQSEALNRAIVDSNPDCVSVLDPAGIVVYVNPATMAAYGLQAKEALVGKLWGDLLPADMMSARDVALMAAQNGEIGRLTVSLAAENGSVRWLESLVAPVRDDLGKIMRLVVMSRDFTHQREAEEQVRWSAAHDALTELPNRSLFQQRLQDATRPGRLDPFALLLLDVDDFKQVNDTLGHDAGDTLLHTVGERLRAGLRDGDFVARLGGDEFAIILRGIASEAAATAAAQRIIENLREPWVHNGRISDCRASIGASVYLLHGSEPSELLKNADIALYAAKVRQQGRIAVFRPAMRAEMQKRSSMLTVARRAIQDDLIMPFYQPKVELTSGSVVGFEALLRWRHPTRGIQAPASIAAAFEDLELAAELTDRMLEQVIADMVTWLNRGSNFGHVAVNAAAADFRKGDFAERLLERLDKNSIPRNCLQVEVTETVFLGRGAGYVERALKTLSAGGIRIALDDFGTGYASLSHLKQFPVDIVKIDRSFVKDIEHHAEDAAIIKAVIGLGRSLDIEVVAEGIETCDQAAYLISQGCRVGQGYLYGKAAPAARVPGLLRTRNHRLPLAA